MSSGLVICEICKREVHQNGTKNKQGNLDWQHCEDGTSAALCSPARVRYASRNEVVGKACFADMEIKK